MIAWPRSYPVSFLVSVLVLVVGFGPGRTAPSHQVLVANFALRWSDLAHQPWRLFTALFVQTKAGVRPTIIGLLVLFPVVEHRIGSRTTLLAMLAGDWISTVAVLVGVRITAAHGSVWAATQLDLRDGGTSSAAHAIVAAAIAASQPSKTRTIAAAVVAAWVVQRLLWGGQLFDFQHGGAAAVGAVVGIATRRRDPTGCR